MASSSEDKSRVTFLHRMILDGTEQGRLETTALLLPGKHASADNLDIVDGKAVWKGESSDDEEETFAFPGRLPGYLGLQQPAPFVLQQPGDGT